jgi:cysteine-rich repeat protein
VCGNGEVERGEQCDDGNDSEQDTCTTSCEVPRCDDRILDGDETDLDCGGACQGCELCLTCSADDDCAPGLTCSDAGECSVHEVMSVSWVGNCGGAAQGNTIDGLPLGTYLATALPSAGTLWLPPFNPPSTGYFYEIQCAGGVVLDELRTPPGVRYQSIATAFAAVTADTQEFDFLGGDLTCYRTDDTCPDNSGSVEFSIDYLCEAN